LDQRGISRVLPSTFVLGRTQPIPLMRSVANLLQETADRRGKLLGPVALDGVAGAGNADQARVGQGVAELLHGLAGLDPALRAVDEEDRTGDAGRFRRELLREDLAPRAVLLEVVGGARAAVVLPAPL